MTPERMKTEVPGSYQAWANVDRSAVKAYVGDPFAWAAVRNGIAA